MDGRTEQPTPAREGVGREMIQGPMATTAVGVPEGSPVRDGVSSRWLIFRDADGSECFGRIEDDTEGAFAIRMPDGELRTVQHERGRQRSVDDSSLELQRLRDAGALATRFASNPVETLVDTLKEHGRERGKDEPLDQLARYGISIDEPSRKKLQPKVSKHPNISGGKPVRYRWVEAKVTDADPTDVLNRGLAARASNADRRQALDDLRRMIDQGALDPTHLALARRAGVHEAVVDWSLVRIEGLAEPLAHSLVAAAAEANAWSFLAAVVLDPARRARAVEARVHLLPPQRGNAAA